MKRILIILSAILLIASIAWSSGGTGTGQATAQPGSEQRLVTLDVKDAPLPELLAMLFKDRGLSYTIEPLANPPKVTAVLNDVSFEAALNEVMKASGAKYTKDGGVYHISQAAAPPTMCPSPVPGPRSVAVIPLKFLTFADVLPVMQGIAGLDCVMSYALDNSIIVKGTDAAIKEARATIARLDVAAAVPQPVRARVELRVTSSDNKAIPRTLSSEAISLMGSEVCMKLDVTPIEASKSARRNELSLKLTPSTAADGKINLKVSGSFQCQIGGLVTRRDFDTTILTSLGKPTIIASDSAEMDGNTETFEMTITVSLAGANNKPAPAKSPKK